MMRARAGPEHGTLVALLNTWRTVIAPGNPLALGVSRVWGGGRVPDVAPTVLALLGPPPHRMDGVVLADALRRPTHPQQNALDNVAGARLGLQQALQARSSADLSARLASG